MKSQEEIIKEKLDAYEEELPEGSLADFRERLDLARSSSDTKSSRTFWFCAMAAATAACLAGALVLMKPEPGPEASGNNFLADVECESKPEELVTDAVIPEAVPSVMSRRTVKHRQTFNDIVVVPAEDNEDENIGTESSNVSEIKEFEQNDEKPGVIQAVQKSEPVSHIRIKPLPAIAAGGVLGGTLLGGLLAASVNSNASPGTSVIHPVYYYDTTNPNSSDRYTGNCRHFLPMKVDASLRWKLADRVSLTTGLEYSMYSSIFEYTHSGEHRQQAHYLGIPLRVDFSFFKTKLVDVYLGAGGVIDYCLAASCEGINIQKDGLSFTLQGAAGAQFNITRYVGIFAEPQVVWAIPSEGRVLQTYRTEHPVAFNAAIGIRFTLGE